MVAAMTTDIERLAKEAGMWDWGIGSELLWTCPADRLAKFAALIAEECALLVERPYQNFKDAEQAHYRHSPEPLRPVAFGFNMDVIRYSANAASEIRQKFPMPKGKA